VRPHGEAVSPVLSGDGVNRITQVAQPVDVTAHSALGDLEAFGEFRGSPPSVGLKE
jgi:hypothetical protein